MGESGAVILGLLTMKNGWGRVNEGLDCGKEDEKGGCEMGVQVLWGLEDDLCAQLAGGQDYQGRRAACAINLAIRHGIQNEIGPIEVLDID